MCSEKPNYASTRTHQQRREKNSSDKCCYVSLYKRCYSDVNVEVFLSNLVYFLFPFFIATDLVVLLIKYENDGVLRVAQLGDHYRLLLN